MADNTTLNAQSGGDTISTDDLGAVKVQRVKVQYGADGSATDVASGTPLPVTDAAGATQTTAAAILAKLSSDPATQTTLAAVLAKLSADPATQTTLAAILTALSNGTQAIVSFPLASETLANVASSATVVTLQASNGSRRAWKCFNDSTAALYIKHGSAASLTSFTVKVAAGGYYEMPLPAYTGIVTGIWDSANGNARLTEGA